MRIDANSLTPIPKFQVKIHLSKKKKFFRSHFPVGNLKCPKTLALVVSLPVLSISIYNKPTWWYGKVTKSGGCCLGNHQSQLIILLVIRLKVPESLPSGKFCIASLITFYFISFLTMTRFDSATFWISLFQVFTGNSKFDFFSLYIYCFSLDWAVLEINLENQIYNMGKKLLNLAEMRK